jgi:hypothetical protein
MVRAVLLAPSAAAMENPRLMSALIAVMDAQAMKGRVIQHPGAVVVRKIQLYTAPVRQTIVSAKTIEINASLARLQ